MRKSVWWWAGVALDLVLLPPAFYMAIAALQIAVRSEGAPLAVGISALFFAAPVFSIFAPLAAWRARALGRPAFHSIALFAAPWIYALFLVLFLFSG